jgi:fucose permease
VPVLGLTSFFTLGVILVLLGVDQAEMARDLSLNLADSGFLGAVLALGMGVGVTSAGPLMDRLPGRPLFVGACLLTSIALFSVRTDMSYARTVVHVALIGTGCGGYDTVLNVATFDRFRTRAARALAALHASATAGAAFGPLLIAWRNEDGHWTQTFHELGALYLAFAIYGALTKFPERSARMISRETPRLTGLFTPTLFALAAIAFAYVGVESGLTMFAVPWAQSHGEAQELGRSGISALWLGLFVGRLTLVPQRRASGALLLIVSGLLGGLIICAASELPGSSLILILGAAGLALGPVYPVMLSLAARRFPNSVGTASGLVAGAGACGGFALPWLSGALGDAFGMEAALVTIGCCALLIAAAALALARSDHMPRTAAVE